jgi:hypothetical protein
LSLANPGAGLLHLPERPSECSQLVHELLERHILFANEFAGS